MVGFKMIISAWLLVSLQQSRKEANETPFSGGVIDTLVLIVFHITKLLIRISLN